MMAFCGSVFGQQSYHSPETPYKVVFREVFNNEYSLRNNGGVPTDVTFTNGSAVFDGDDVITYQEKSYGTEYTLYARINADASDDTWYLSINSANSSYFLFNYEDKLYHKSAGVSVSWDYVDFSGSHDMVITRTGTSVKLYIDGSQYSTTKTLSSSLDYTENRIGLAFTGSIDLYEIYNYELSSDEVYNLSQDLRYSPSTLTPLLHVTAERGVIQDLQGGTLTNTATTVDRSGSVWVMGFGTTSKVGFPSVSKTSSEDMTISLWYKLDEEIGITIPLLGNSSIGSYSMLYLSSLLISLEGDENNNYAYGDLDDISAYQWHHIGVVKDGSSVQIYQNGVALSMTDAVMDTTITVNQIGARGVSTTFNGEMGDVIIDDEAWSAERVSQVFTSRKQKYLK
jgi:hypothetical protein